MSPVSAFELVREVVTTTARNRDLLLIAACGEDLDCIAKAYCTRSTINTDRARVNGKARGTDSCAMIHHRVLYMCIYSRREPV